jgi:hypothetical protein
MLKLQQEFSLKVMRLWDLGTELIFIDECTCNPWNKGIKMWVNRDDPFQLDLAPTRGADKGSAAVLGAISSKQRELKWVASTDTNNECTFRSLLKRIADWPLEPQNTVVIMDQASYHKGDDLIEFFLEKGIGVIFLPASSSNLNPIGMYYLFFPP